MVRRKSFLHGLRELSTPPDRLVQETARRGFIKLAGTPDRTDVVEHKSTPLTALEEGLASVGRKWRREAGNTLHRAPSLLSGRFANHLHEIHVTADQLEERVRAVSHSNKLDARTGLQKKGY
ncbi:hypothetical protein G7054_g12547 [Neopestalotiopsis clavispora]|nr:hypothetical protein G7054_g12547 [Neopestalotiopsis clavispora]